MLAAMRRRYRSALYEEKVNLVKARMPHSSIGVDVIVGFPGETDSDFQDTFDFLHRLPVSYLHVFTYSERDNTLAANMPGIVPLSKRKERNRKLRNLSAKKAHDFAQEALGTLQAVLFEEEIRDGFVYGYTPHYIRVKHRAIEGIPGSVINCMLDGFGTDGLVDVKPVTADKPYIIS